MMKEMYYGRWTRLGDCERCAGILTTGGDVQRVRRRHLLVLPRLLSPATALMPLVPDQLPRPHDAPDRLHLCAQQIQSALERCLRGLFGVPNSNDTELPRRCPPRR